MPGSIEGIWIPNPKYIVECCLLMAAVYGTEDNKIIELAKEYLPHKDRNLDINLCEVDENK